MSVKTPGIAPNPQPRLQIQGCTPGCPQPECQPAEGRSGPLGDPITPGSLRKPRVSLALWSSGEPERHLQSPSGVGTDGPALQRRELRLQVLGQNPLPHPRVSCSLATGALPSTRALSGGAFFSSGRFYLRLSVLSDSMRRFYIEIWICYFFRKTIQKHQQEQSSCLSHLPSVACVDSTASAGAGPHLS